MSNEPLVSIIVPFFNAAKFLDEAIMSVFEQSYQAWELFLVDDGSTDESTDIARRYAAEHPGKVVYLEHPDHRNHGKSASRNRGIHSASGKYLAFLDADDVWLSNILEEEVAILESQPEAAMVYGPIQWWYSWTGESVDVGRDYVEELGLPPNTLIRPPTLLTRFLQDRAAVPSDILVRRESIERVGGFEEEFKVLYEDQVFYAKVCLAAPVFASGKCWYRYRQHPDSSCARAMITGEYYSSRLVFLHWLVAYVSNQGVQDAALRWALYKELWPYRHPAAYRLLRRIVTRSNIINRVARFGEPLRRVRNALGQMRKRSSWTSSIQRGDGELW
jgi:glycosyltransferase involved in cell wall biosynthesis